VGALLAFAGPIWAVIKPFWKYLVAAIALIVLIWSIHHWYEGKLDAAYDRGVAVTEAKDAKVLEQRERENTQLVAELKTSAAVKQAELEGKIHANQLIADDLRAQLRARRVCSDERSGRAVPGDSGAAGKGDGATGDAGSAQPVEEGSFPTVGEDVVTIVESCQVSTDKLITLQSFVTDLMTKLKRMAKASHAK
jgi:hypothetical protein